MLKPLKLGAGFQYRLRFFHKCRSPFTCDPGQVDRHQILGSALESTCGSPIIVVLVRYRNDPETGLSKECHRAQFPLDKSPFGVKAVIVPADRVSEYMDKPLLRQPRLVDAQGRHLIGGPDVSPEGEIYVTPLESNGIAHLNNFCLMAPWTGQISGSQDPYGDDGPRGVSARGASDTSWLGSGSRVMQVSSDGRAHSYELCMVVQLLRQDTRQPGKWFAYDIPHLVSRPFQVLSRNAWAAMQCPKPRPEQSALRLQLQPLDNIVLRLRHSLGAPQPRYAGPIPGLGAQPPQGHYPSSPGAMFGGAGNAGGRGMAPQQDFRMGRGMGGCGVEAGLGFVLGPGQILPGRASAGGVPEHRCSSTSGGSPHGQRSSRARRRSCLTKDSSHDDGSGGGTAAAASAAGPSSMSAAEGTATGPLLGVLASAAMDVRAQTATPCSSSAPVATVFVASAADPLAYSGTEGAEPGGRVAEREGGAADELGLTHGSSAMLLDINMAELLNGLDAQPFLAEEGKEVEGNSKRVRSNTSEPCAPAFASGNSSSNLVSSPRAHAPDMYHQQQAFVTQLQQQQAQAQQQQQQQQPMSQDYLQRHQQPREPQPPPPQQFYAGGYPFGYADGCGGGGCTTAGSNPCSGTKPYVTQQSDCGSWSAETPAATAAATPVMDQLDVLRKQSTGLSGTGAAAALSYGMPCNPSTGGNGASGIGPSSQLDALMQQLLGQPGGMQEVLDRMDQEQDLQPQQSQAFGSGDMARQGPGRQGMRA